MYSSKYQVIILLKFSFLVFTKYLNKICEYQEPKLHKFLEADIKRHYRLYAEEPIDEVSSMLQLNPILFGKKTCYIQILYNSGLNLSVQVQNVQNEQNRWSGMTLIEA